MFKSVMSPPPFNATEIFGAQTVPSAPGEHPVLLSAVICTYQRYAVLPRAIDSLLAQILGPQNLEILILDNSPDPQTAAAFAAKYLHHPNLRYILLPSPGLSEARNEALTRARGNIIAFLDDDAIATPGWGEALINAFALHGDKLGAAGGPARPLWLSPRPAWLTDPLLAHLSMLDLGEKPKILRPEQKIVGCNMAFDTALLKTIGGFNPKLGRLGPELSLRSNGEPGVLDAVHAAGRLIAYAPAAAVDHAIDPSRLTQSWFRRRAAWQAVSDYLMDPEKTAAHAPAAERHLRLVEHSRTRRRAVGFFGDAPDGEAFSDDLLLIRELVIATLHGGAEIDPDPPAPLRSLQSRLWLNLRRTLRKSPQTVATVRRLRRLMS